MKHKTLLWGLIIFNTIVSCIAVVVLAFAMFSPQKDSESELRSYVDENTLRQNTFVQKEIDRLTEFVNKENGRVIDFVNKTR